MDSIMSTNIDMVESSIFRLKERKPISRRIVLFNTSGSNVTITISAIITVLFFFASITTHAQDYVNVGDCTPGDLKCTADVVLMCECYEELIATDNGEEFVTACMWEATEEYCGEPVSPPQCTRDYVGATYEFVDEIKVCKCYESSGCSWETDH